MSSGRGIVAQPRSAPRVPEDCRRCPVRATAVCGALDADKTAWLENFKRGDRVLGAGSVLFHQGDRPADLFNLVDGWVVLEHSLPDGRRQVLDFVLPGAFLGDTPEEDGTMAYAAVCLTDVSVCLFPRSGLASFTHAHPELLARLGWLNARAAGRAHRALTNVGCRPARARIVHLLSELASRARSAGAHQNEDGVDLPLTQSHIGDALGLTSVYVSQCLRDLREQGVLVFRGGSLRILDLRALRSAYGIEPLALAEGGQGG